MPSHNYLGNKLLDFVLGAQSYTPPVTLYLGLLTDTPTPSTGGTEVTGGSYARVAKTNNLTNFPAASGKTKSNGTAVTFPTASALWGDVEAVGVYDDPTAGNLLMYASLTTPRTVNSADTPAFAIGQLVFNAI